MSRTPDSTLATGLGSQNSTSSTVIQAAHDGDHYQLSEEPGSQSSPCNGTEWGDIIRLSSVPRLLADRVTGKKPSPKSVYRWVTHGVRGVRLEAFQMPFGVCTTVQLLNQFVRSLNNSGRTIPVQMPTPRRRQREIERARKLAQEIATERKGGAR